MEARGMEARGYDAVLLLGFGGPEGQDDVIPFLRNVTRGRGVPESRLETVATHYRASGGVSPVNAQNRALRDALQAELAGRGTVVPVYWGNRNWAPYLGDVVAEAVAAGHSRLLALTTSAYSSYSSCRQYRDDLAEARGATLPGDAVCIDAVRPYFDHPGFVTPFVLGVRSALAEFERQGLAAAELHVLFTTHSIPQADAERSGPRERSFGAGGAYEAQHRAVAEVVMAAVAAAQARGSAAVVAEGGREGVAVTAGAAPAWSLVFQSRSGPPGMPWLKPDVNDAITVLAEAGTRAVVVVPIGFISDHMEVTWDLDTEAAATAAAHDMEFTRVSTPGLHPVFVAGLVDLLLERLTPAVPAERCALTALGPWPDACPAGCCEKGPARGAEHPAASVAGVTGG
ncbi:MULTISPECIES: ferrochelatase [Cryobacterium]|uniref:Coproporphyrin III ferrochelatase n=1 Tax=Cryobacterium breve TaxID=1259258 RepID=A0ABY2IZW2_9MICO|nr:MULTISPECIES: ferrochelatase [Cryobacterium]TFC93147.1 ferrochelatase [Cryobacterium sp. TmT3-12]TFC96199.1 ferrochelatase [Cryobacterium breve]